MSKTICNILWYAEYSNKINCDILLFSNCRFSSVVRQQSPVPCDMSRHSCIWICDVHTLQDNANLSAILNFTLHLFLLHSSLNLALSMKTHGSDLCLSSSVLNMQQKPQCLKSVCLSQSLSLSLSHSQTNTHVICFWCFHFCFANFLSYCTH